MKLLLVISSVYAQCFSLENSKLCAGMKNFAILPAKEFTDAATLDTYLASVQLNNPTVSNAFKTAMQCPGFNGQGGRYSISTTCAFFVKASESACRKQYKDQSVTLQYCASSCQTLLSSLNAIFSNPQICDATPAQNSLTARQTLLTSGSDQNNLNNFCKTLSASPDSTAPTCFRGASEDVAKCGFLDQTETAQYCAKNQDSCCTPQAAPGLEVLAPANNTFMYFMIIGGAVTALAIFYFVYQKVSKRKMRPTTAYQPKRGTVAENINKFFNSELPGLPTHSDKQLPTATRDAEGRFVVGEDSSSFPNSQKEIKLQVVEEYYADLDDEIDLMVGDIVILHEEFDDGWAIGKNLSSGATGIFPLALCEEMASTGKDKKKMERTTRTYSLLPPARSFL